ncbi:NAD-dependent epimerase/dehydratase family protein [Actinospongicola halichondriae]|uniref:NAD-dependent epimerase/dehydratase family protein n=1 Tax=Actinospongicola halichondriae TaxID=3236844 RepID=UPI003D460FB3
MERHARRTALTTPVDPRTAALGGQRVLVTGGTGFLGAHLTRALVGLGAEVHVLTSGTQDAELDDVRHHLGSIVDPDSVRAAVAAAQPDVAFHLAAFTHVGRSWDAADACVRVNVEGTMNLLLALADSGCRRTVTASTSDVYGAGVVPFRESATPLPTSPYATSKRAAELLCTMGAEASGWPIVQLRVFNVYGPGQTPDRLIPEIIARANDGDELLMTRGTQTREFNFVDDIVEGFLVAAVAEGAAGELVNLCSGTEVSVAEVAETVLDLMGNPIRAQLGALPERPIEIPRVVGDPTRAREVLGWSARTSLADGLSKTIDWYSQR